MILTITGHSYSKVYIYFDGSSYYREAKLQNNYSQSQGIATVKSTFNFNLECKSASDKNLNKKYIKLKTNRN